MMLEYLAWKRAAQLVESSMKKTIKSKVVAYDFARLMKDAKEVKISEFASAIISNM